MAMEKYFDNEQNHKLFIIVINLTWSSFPSPKSKGPKSCFKLENLLLIFEGSFDNTIYAPGSNTVLLSKMKV